VRVADCSRCGAGISSYGPVLCHRCRAVDAEAARRENCPDCGRFLRLKPAGRCVRCCRVCADCGHPVRTVGVERCRHCRRKAEAAAAKSTCPRCGRLGIIRSGTGWCGTCSRPPPRPAPARPCSACGALARKRGDGLCHKCWTNSPTRPLTQASNLADRLDHPPGWLADFAEYVAARHCVARACNFVSALGRLLVDDRAVHPQALVERARQPGRSGGRFARVLEAFLVERGLAFGLDQPARLAAGRRLRRVEATPEELRPAIASFADHLVASQTRARRAGTLARTDNTIEATLAVVRDLGRFVLAERAKNDWAAIERSDIEAFLANRPRNAGRCLSSTRQFFRWARKRKLVLVDPTAGMTRPKRRAFGGQALTIPEQRRLFRRWNADPDVHPHEALTGLLALVHAATCSDIRHLRVDDIDRRHNTMRLGSRRHLLPLDPPTAAAIERCLAHRDKLGTLNPHLVVTRTTRTRATPCSPYYVTHLLGPIGVPPRRLRETRLVDLVISVGPKVVSEALDMNADGLLAYIPDDVNEVLLDQP
jgi:site-specific recombinase XerD